MRDTRKIIQQPLIKEQTTSEREIGNIVTFRVALAANKIEIKRAVEELFEVTVLDVPTSRVHGKKRRVGKHEGQRSSWKKARVRLGEGDTIEFFEGV